MARIAVACGGTGGHTFPGMAAGRKLVQRGHEVTLWLAGRSIESAVVDGWEGPREVVWASGFNRGARATAALVSAWSLARATATCLRRMAGRRPDALLAMGSYACVGPVVAARTLGSPIVLHEANAVPGRATALLARRLATCVAVALEAASRSFAPTRAIVTGMPLREQFETFAPVNRERLPLTVLVMGGSLGAVAINDAAVAAFAAWTSEPRPLVVHLAGKGRAEALRARYEAAGTRAEVYDFHTDMPSLYRRATVAVSRAGASACAELAVCGIPSILVPLPNAPGDHQTLNALALEAAGAAVALPQSSLTADNLRRALAELVGDPARYARYQDAARRAGRPDGAARLADVVESALKRS